MRSQYYSLYTRSPKVEGNCKAALSVLIVPHGWQPVTFVPCTLGVLGPYVHTCYSSGQVLLRFTNLTKITTVQFKLFPQYYGFVLCLKFECITY